MSATIDIEFPIERITENHGPTYERVTSFAVGKTCKSIERDGGGVWLQVDTHHRYWVPDRNIKCIHEQRATEAKSDPNALPEYVYMAGELFACRECQRSFGKLQAVKTHYGMAHGRE